MTSTYDQRKQTIKLRCKQEHVKDMEWYVFITELIEDLRSLNTSISIAYLLRQLLLYNTIQ